MPRRWMTRVNLAPIRQKQKGVFLTIDGRHLKINSPVFRLEKIFSFQGLKVLSSFVTNLN